MATKEELERIYRELGVTEKEASKAFSVAFAEGTLIYDKMHSAIVGQKQNAIFSALERILADFALESAHAMYKETLLALAESAAIRIELFLKHHSH